MFKSNLSPTVQIKAHSITVPISNNMSYVVHEPLVRVGSLDALDAVCRNVLLATFPKLDPESFPEIINPRGVGVPKIVQTIEQVGHTRYDVDVTIKDDPTPQEMEIVAAVNLLRSTAQRLINPPKGIVT